MFGLEQIMAQKGLPAYQTPTSPNTSSYMQPAQATGGAEGGTSLGQVSSSMWDGAARQKLQTRPDYASTAAWGDAPVQDLFAKVRAGQNMGKDMGLEEAFRAPSFQSGGYQMSPWMGGHAVYKALDPSIAGDNAHFLNGTRYDVYDNEGNFVSSNIFDSISSSTSTGEFLKGLAMMAGPFAATIGGVAAAGAGAAGAGAGTGAGAGALTGGGFVGEGALSGIGAWDGALAGAAGAGGAGTAGGLGGILSSLGSGNLGSLGSILKAGGALGSALGLGGGGGGGGTGGAGGMGGLSNLLPLLAGGVDASRQGAAADRMLQWLNTNQGKMEGFMNPDSPEYKGMWEAMSRKDAAAGRNSQYGPRTSDFLAKVAEAKANNIKQFTTGTSRAYADALNQNAAKYSGLLGGLGNLTQGGGSSGGGGIQNLSSLMNSIFGAGNTDYSFSLPDSSWTGGTMSNDDIWDMINGGSAGGGGFEIPNSDFDISEWWM